MPDNFRKLASKPGSAQGSALCQQLTETVLDDYHRQLIDMVENSTQGLSVDDIETFFRQYKANTLEADRSRFKVHFQRCLNRREQEVFDPNRREPFKRVVTMRFVDLFPPEGKLDGEGQYISRRMLFPFFRVLEKMVGSDPFLKGHDICTQAAETVKSPDGIIIWEDLYANDQALEAVDDLLMRLVEHFENPMRRISWMLDLINNDLSDPRDYDFEGDVNVDWQLDEHGLINVLRHLFRHLRRRVKDSIHVHVLTERYGQDSARKLIALITALDHST